jgi:hypothetical protein
MFLSSDALLLLDYVLTMCSPSSGHGNATFWRQWHYLQPAVARHHRTAACHQYQRKHSSDASETHQARVKHSKGYSAQVAAAHAHSLGQGLQHHCATRDGAYFSIENNLLRVSSIQLLLVYSSIPESRALFLFSMNALHLPAVVAHSHGPYKPVSHGQGGAGGSTHLQPKACLKSSMRPPHRQGHRTGRTACIKLHA